MSSRMFVMFRTVSRLLSRFDLGVPAEGFEGHGPYLLLIRPTNPDGGSAQAAGHAHSLAAVLPVRQ